MLKCDPKKRGLLMDVYEAILGRRSIRKYKSDVPERDLLEKAIESACWAPSHRNSQPWEFRVLTQSSRDKICEIYSSAIEDNPNIPDDIKQKKLPFARDLGGAPAVVIALSKVSENQRDGQENDEAVSAAMQNFALALHNDGLGTIWLTPSILIKSEDVKHLFQIPDDLKILGVFPVGYPDHKPEVKLREPISAKMIWFD